MQAKNKQPGKVRHKLSQGEKIAIISGIFTIVVAMVSILPSLLSSFELYKPSTLPTSFIPTWQPLPIVNTPPFSEESNPPIAVTNFRYNGYDLFYTGSASPNSITLDKLPLATTGPIIIEFDLSSLETKSWIKIDNGIFFKIQAIETLQTNERNNVMLTFTPGGGGSKTKFDLNVNGTLSVGDVLQSPPAIGADFFTLEPGEIMVFDISTGWKIPPGKYTMIAGFVYEHKQQNFILWINNPITITSPDNPVFWKLSGTDWITTSP